MARQHQRGNGGGAQGSRNQQRQNGGRQKDSGDERKPPVFEARIKMVKAVVWENQSDEGAWYSVTVSRSYKDGENWKQASSFGRDDLLTLAECLRLSYLWIANAQGAQGITLEGRTDDDSFGEDLD